VGLPNKTWWLGMYLDVCTLDMSYLNRHRVMTVTVGGFQVSQWYDLVVFTASMEIYGAAVAEKLDRNRGILKRRYYRQVSSYLLLH